MRKTPDIVLEELENRPSCHMAYSSINGPNTCCPPSPLRGRYYVGVKVLAKIPGTSDFKGGRITLVIFKNNKTYYQVKLEPYHGGQEIETDEVA